MASVVHSIASFSWIDPKSGLPEVDVKGDPGHSVRREDITAGKLYRFANFLEAEVDTDGGGLANPRFTKASGMIRGPSYGGLDSAPVGRIGRSVSAAADGVVFRQIVGCRTESPEKIGAGAGAGVGALGGAFVGGKVGGSIGVIGGPPGIAVGGLIGAGIGGLAGYFAGKEVAELVTAFPPIWTELELVIHRDGSASHRVVSHSLFPSMTFYVHESALMSMPDAGAGRLYLRQGLSYDGVPNLAQWKQSGWGPAREVQRSGPTAGNPWGMEDPGPQLGSGALRNECPPGYRCN